MPDDDLDPVLLKESLEAIVKGADIGRVISSTKRDSENIWFLLDHYKTEVGDSGLLTFARSLAPYEPVVSYHLFIATGHMWNNAEDPEGAFQKASYNLHNPHLISLINDMALEPDHMEHYEAMRFLVKQAGTDTEALSSLLVFKDVYQNHPDIVDYVLKRPHREIPYLITRLLEENTVGVVSDLPERTISALVDLFGRSVVDMDLGDPIPEAEEPDVAGLAQYLTDEVNPILPDMPIKWDHQNLDTAVGAFIEGVPFEVVKQIIDKVPVSSDSIEHQQKMGSRIARGVIESAYHGWPLDNVLNHLELEPVRNFLQRYSDLDRVDDSVIDTFCQALYAPTDHLLRSTNIFAQGPSFYSIEDQDLNLARIEALKHGKASHELFKGSMPVRERTALMRLFAHAKSRHMSIGSTDRNGWSENAANAIKRNLWRYHRSHDAYGTPDEEIVDDINHMTPLELSTFILYSDMMAENGKDDVGFASPASWQSAIVEAQSDMRIIKGKIWELGKEYGRLEGLLGAEYSTAEIISLGISGLIGRHSDKVAEASRVFGPNMDRAREYLERQHQPANIYRDLKNQIASLGSGDDSVVDEVVDYLRGLARSAGELIGNPHREDLKAVNYLSHLFSRIGSEKLVGSLTAQMFKSVPSDLFFDSETNCCTLLPNGTSRDDGFIYLDEGDIGMLHFYDTDQGPKARRGTAFLYNSVSDSKTTLVVDSLEGGANIELNARPYFEFAYSAILDVARDMNADKILFNTTVGGDIPKEFIAYLKNRGLPVEVFNLPGNPNSAFKGLESFDHESPAQSRQGYFIDLQRSKQAVVASR